VIVVVNHCQVAALPALLVIGVLGMLVRNAFKGPTILTLCWLTMLAHPGGGIAGAAGDWRARDAG
jgi:hypothetical protein